MSEIADKLLPVVGKTEAPAAGQQVSTFRKLLFRGAVVWVLVVLLIVCQILYPGFIARQNLFNILTQNAAVGLIALGMTYVMIAGGFDLSVGAVYALGATIFAMWAPQLGLPLAFLLTILAGACAGLINGLVVTRFKVNPFIATLGTASIFGGFAYLYSGSAPILVNMPSFRVLGSGSWFGIPISLLILVVAFVIGAVVLSKTVYGRSLYAVGGNPEAARLAGLRVDLLKVSTYVLVSALAALGGMLIASRLGIGQADIAGAMSLDAIAIVIIGGTSLFGGSGAVWRTAVGLLLLAVLTNLFDALALDSNFQSLIKGAILIGAVALDAASRRR